MLQKRLQLIGKLHLGRRLEILKKHNSNKLMQQQQQATILINGVCLLHQEVVVLVKVLGLMEGNSLLKK